MLLLLRLLLLLLQISQLHPAAREFAQEDAAADVAHSSKMNQLIRAKDGAAPQEDGQQQPAEQGDALPMAFCWTSVIWTLALQHKNLQVRTAPSRLTTMHKFTCNSCTSFAQCPSRLPISQALSCACTHFFHFCSPSSPVQFTACKLTCASMHHITPASCARLPLQLPLLPCVLCRCNAWH